MTHSASVIGVLGLVAIVLILALGVPTIGRATAILAVIGAELALGYLFP